MTEMNSAEENVNTISQPELPTWSEDQMVLRSEGLVKRYGKRTVVNQASFNVKQGEIVGLLGPNGAGKSTFLRLISGVYRPCVGEITADGEMIYENPNK